MYEPTKSLYPLLVTELAKKVKGEFILNGAYITIDEVSSAAPSTTLPASVSANGFTYSSTTTNTPAAPAVTGNGDIHFVIKKADEPELPTDVNGVIKKVGSRYVLELMQEVSIVNMLAHDYLTMNLVTMGDLTVENLRDIISKVRAFYFLDELTKDHDVFILDTPKSELDELLEKIKEYLSESTKTGEYQFDVIVDSTTDKIDATVLNVRLERNDGSRAKKVLIKIDLRARKFEPAIMMQTFFANDPSGFAGRMVFLDAAKAPFTGAYMLTQEESNYIVGGVLRIVSDLKYSYVKDA